MVAVFIKCHNFLPDWEHSTVIDAVFFDIWLFILENNGSICNRIIHIEISG